MGVNLKQLYNNFEERVGLLRQFRIHTFWVLIVVGVSMVYYLNSYIRADVLERLGESTSFVTDTTISPHLTIDDLQWPSSAKSQQKFESLINKKMLDRKRRTETTVESEYIVATKIWNRQGRVVYDTTGKTTGEVHEESELQEAFNDEINADYTEGDAEDRFIINKKDLIELYVPIHIKGIKEPVGAYEVYLATHAINEFSRNTLGVIIIIVVLGLVFLYITLGWLFSRAHKKISAKNQKLTDMTDRIVGSIKELEDNYLGTIQALAMAVDAKDHYTAGHSFRVAAFAKEIGKILGLSEDALRDLERGARFHDIGKIGIKESILNKKAGLGDIEYSEMKKHTIIGAKILGQVKFLKDIVPIVRGHHERLDGTGYPDGLTKYNIPLAARIVAVADVFDAMTSDRPYRKAYDAETAFNVLKKGAGTLFDKEVVHALIEAYKGSSSDLEWTAKENTNFFVDSKVTKIDKKRKKPA